MASPDSFEPIEDYIRAQWAALHPTIPLAFENEAFPPPNNPSTFVFVEVFGTLFTQMSIGAGTGIDDNLWREFGQVWMHVLVKRGTGTRSARTYANALARLFKMKQLGGIRFMDASIGAGEPGPTDGNYYRLTVSVEFERDE